MMNKMNLNRNLSAKRRNSLIPYSNRTQSFNSKVPNLTPLVATSYGKNASLLNLLKGCFTSLLRTPPKYTIFVCALALTLPAVIAILSVSFKVAEENLLKSRNVSVFLNTKVDLHSATQLAKTLASNQHILTAELSPIEIPDDEILTIDIQPSATLEQAQLDSIVAELNSLTSVDFVAADSIWLQQSVDAITTTRKFAWLSIAITVAVTMVLTCLISLSDLIRQKPELRVLQQMGASRTMLLKPLMLRSLILTILALGVAILLAWGLIELLPHIADMSNYHQFFPRSFPIQQIVSLGLIAISSSFLAVRLFSKKAIIPL